MAKPRFKINNYPPHSTLGNRIFLEPVNFAAHKMIRDRDNAIIKDFPLIIYECDHKK